MPNKYSTIVIDPPWEVKMVGKFGRRKNRAQKLPYETMSLKKIKDFKIKKYASKGAHVYLWVPNKYLRDAFDVFDNWGVNFHLMLVGVKPSGVAPCCGYVFGTEFCLLGFYGKPMLKFKKVGLLNWFKMFNKQGKHSTKPDEFYRIVSKMSPGPYIDIFSRKDKVNWDSYGKEKGKFNPKERSLLNYV